MYKSLIDRNTISKNRRISDIDCLLSGIDREEYRGDIYYFRRHKLIIICEKCNKIILRKKTNTNSTKVICHTCGTIYNIKVEKETIESIFAEKQ